MSEKESATEWIEKTNEAFMDTMEQNTKMQQAFLDAWIDSLGEEKMDAENLEDLYEGYSRAFEKWMEATENASDKISEQLSEEGEVNVQEFRDIWLDAANEALKEIISTTAFATAVGEILDESSEATKQIDRNVQDSLRSAGLATAQDIKEVGERLIELERRQHELQNKVQEMIEKLE